MYTGNGGYGGGRGGGGGYGGGGGGQKKAKALYDFYGEGPNDLTFKKGDVITVVSENATSGPEWWVGELRGKRGEFPHNHVELSDGGGGGNYNGGGDTDHYGIPYGNPGPSIPMSTFNSSPSYSSPSYNTPKFGSPSSAALVSDEPAKPEKPSKPAKSSFSGGGGMDGGLNAKIAFVCAILAFLLLFLGLIFPWYKTTYEPGNTTRLYHWDTVQEYKIYGATSVTAPTTNKVILKSYKGLRLFTLRGVAITSIVFLVPALLGILTQIVMFFTMMRDGLNGMKPLLIVSCVTFLLFLIGWGQLFRFGSAWKKDVEPGCASVGPCSAWVGAQIGYGQWGPAFGWMLITASICFSAADLVIVLLKVKSDGLD